LSYDVSEGSVYGVDGIEMVISEREENVLYGQKASDLGYTGAVTYNTDLKMTTKATGAVNSMPAPAPHGLRFGEVLNTTVFTRLPVLERLDNSEHTITMTVDTAFIVRETDESNTWSLDFRY
jgi:hypothetical protein